MRKSSSLIITILSLLLIFFIVFSITGVISKGKSQDYIYHSLDKSFYELLENVEKIENALLKAQLSKDSYQMLKLASVIEESSAFAISDLNSFEAESPLFNINTFLNQAGDYVRYVALSHFDGTAPTESELNTFSFLSGYATKLKNELLALREKVAGGVVSYSTALKKADHSMGEMLSGIESGSFGEFSPLSYGGKFNGQINENQGGHIYSFPEIDSTAALKIALSTQDGDIPFVFKGETGGIIPYYMFSHSTEAATYNLDLCKNGGKLLHLSVDRSLGDSAMGLEEAKNHAVNFLDKMGYTSFTEVDFENSGTIYSATFCKGENDVIYYPDMIKIDVALDTGEIIGFNASSFLINHKSRIFPQASEKTVSVLEDLNNTYGITSLNKVVIPATGNEESYCFEALFYHNGRMFLTYINAITGIQEEILILEETEYGKSVK